MRFRLDINEPGAAGADVDLQFPNSASIQVTHPANQLYDQVHRVTWVSGGRAYEALIGRVTQHGQIGAAPQIP
jgi:hypothetical protein